LGVKIVIAHDGDVEAGLERAREGLEAFDFGRESTCRLEGDVNEFIFTCTVSKIK
jgi:hypothetical protein